MSHLYALGLNHQTAPLEVRERVVFHVERLRESNVGVEMVMHEK